jgi:hypothetical protein
MMSEAENEKLEGEEEPEEQETEVKKKKKFDTEPSLFEFGDDEFYKKWSGPIILGPFIHACFALLIVVSGQLVLNSWEGTCNYPLDGNMILCMCLVLFEFSCSWSVFLVFRVYCSGCICGLFISSGLYLGFSWRLCGRECSHTEFKIHAIHTFQISKMANVLLHSSTDSKFHYWYSRCSSHKSFHFLQTYCCWAVPICPVCFRDVLADIRLYGYLFG